MTKPTLAEAIETLDRLLADKTMTLAECEAVAVVKEAAEKLASRDAFMAQGSFWNFRDYPLKEVHVEYAGCYRRIYSRTEAELMFGVEAPSPGGEGVND